MTLWMKRATDFSSHLGPGGKINRYSRLISRRLKMWHRRYARDTIPTCTYVIRWSRSTFETPPCIRRSETPTHLSLAYASAETDCAVWPSSLMRSMSIRKSGVTG